MVSQSDLTALPIVTAVLVYIVQSLLVLGEHAKRLFDLAHQRPVLQLINVEVLMMAVEIQSVVEVVV